MALNCTATHTTAHNLVGGSFISVGGVYLVLDAEAVLRTQSN